MSRGRKPKSKNNALNWEQFFNKNVGAYLQNIIIELSAVENREKESGFGLLKKIKISKAKLVEDKKLKEEKELPPINEKEVPFAIPENWVWCRLGNICIKIGSGSTPKGSNYSENGIPFFRSQNIYNTELIYDDIKFITKDVQRQMTGTVVYADDILLNITGGSIGRCALVPKDFKEGNVSQHVSIIRPICISNNFLHKVLLTPFFQSSIFNSVTGAGREGLPKYNLEQLLIPLPPLSDQQKIINFIKDFENNLLKEDSCYFNSEVEQKIITLHESQLKGSEISTELTHQLSLVKKLRQQLLQDAVQGKLVEQNKNDEPASELLKKIKAEKEKLILNKNIKQGKLQEAEQQDDLHFEIPENWVWCALDEISKNITDGTHQTPTYTKEGIPFISAQHVKPFKFTPDNRKYVSYEAYLECIKNKKPEVGDILITRVGAIGEAAVIDQALDFAFYVSLGLIQPFKNLVNSKYLELVINSPYGNTYSKGNVSSKGSSAGNYNLGRLRSFLIPFAPLTEQNRIVQKVDELMRYCNDLETSIKQSQSQNEKLLQKVLREALRG